MSLIDRSGVRTAETGAEVPRNYDDGVRSLGAESRRALVVALGTLLSLLLLLTGTVGVAPPAYATDDALPVIVDLEAIEPALPARDGTLTLRGKATNRSEEPITAAQVVLWRRTAAITSNADLTDLANRDPGEVTGHQAWDAAESSYLRLTDDQNPVWEPGEVVPFEVSAPLAALDLGFVPGAYLVGADIVGRVAGRALITVGATRTLVPVADEGLAATTGTNRAVTAVVLSSRPSMISPGLFLDNHLADELSPSGRLTLLLNAARRDRVSWLIDPALHQEITAMAAGYRVEGATEPNPVGQQHALRWLTDFGELDRNNGYRTPFGLPDVSMLAHHHLSGILQRANAAGERVERIADLPVVAYAHGGLIEPSAVPLAETGEPVAVLAANPDTPAALLSPIATVPIVNYSLDTTAGGPGPEPWAGIPQVRQRLLAQSYLAALGDPGSTTVRVITTAAAAAADPATDAPWVRRATLADLLAESPQGWSGVMPYGNQARAAELGPAQVDELRQIGDSMERYADMLVDPGPVAVESDATIARTASSWWRTDPGGFEAFARPQAVAVEQLWSGRAFALTAQRSVLMSGQSGSFPMTVTNHLDQNVRVTLTFDSDQPQRLSIPTMPDVMIGAQQSVTVNVQPRAVGNGPVRVSALVTTPGGVPVSKRVWLTVEATQLGRVGWIIVVASGIVLLAATMLRIRQVRRERLDATLPAEVVPADPTAADPTVHTTPPVVTIHRSDRSDRSDRGDEW
jgi:hypothetical protein